MMGMTTTGEEEEEEGLKGTGRDKSEGDENELEEEKVGEQPRLIRRLSQVAILPRNSSSNPFLHPYHPDVPPHCCPANEAV